MLQHVTIIDTGVCADLVLTLFPQKFQILTLIAQGTGASLLSQKLRGDFTFKLVLVQ
jgi:hypothetical protein